MDILAKLDELHAAGEMHGFSLWPAGRDGYQANLAVGVANSWRIRFGKTPTDAVSQLFDGSPGLEVGDDEMTVARDVFEPELPELEDSVFD